MIDNPVREFGNQATSGSWTKLLVGDRKLTHTRNRTEYLTPKSVSEAGLLRFVVGDSVFKLELGEFEEFYLHLRKS